MNRATVSFRPATLADLPVIVGLLADDALGSRREKVASPLPQCYHEAFLAIDGDPNNELVVADLAGPGVVGVLQLTFIPSLTYQGGWRAQVEGVRIRSDLRDSGVGRQLFHWAIGRARERGCHMVQLTSDKARHDAIRFYERLGFIASHEGMKLHLDDVSGEV